MIRNKTVHHSISMIDIYMHDQYDPTDLRYILKSPLMTFFLFKLNIYIDPNYLSMFWFNFEPGIYIPFIRRALLVMVYALFPEVDFHMSDYGGGDNEGSAKTGRVTTTTGFT